MNERIKQLALECYNPYSNFDYEKFAELIVQECINVSLKSSHRYDDMGAIIANDIAEHFGVEE
jgi:hypothetical protein